MRSERRRWQRNGATISDFVWITFVRGPDADGPPRGRSSSQDESIESHCEASKWLVPPRSHWLLRTIQRPIKISPYQ
jgi:hypothetical protein